MSSKEKDQDRDSKLIKKTSHEKIRTTSGLRKTIEFSDDNLPNNNMGIHLKSKISFKKKPHVNKYFNSENEQNNSGNNEENNVDDILEEEDSHAKRKLILVIIVCSFFMFCEFVGGLVANSIAIMSDAAHLLSDLIGFVISLKAVSMANKKRNENFTFGYYRAEVVGAMLSIFIIWILTITLLDESIHRIFDEHHTVDGKIMLITSTIGLLFNMIMVYILHAGGGECHHGHSHGGGGHGHSHDNKKLNAEKKKHGHSHAHDQSHSHSHDNNEIDNDNDKEKEVINIKSHNHNKNTKIKKEEHNHSHAHDSGREHGHSHNDFSNDEECHSHSHNHSKEHNEHGHSHARGRDESSHNHSHSKDHGHLHKEEEEDEDYSHSHVQPHLNFKDKNKAKDDKDKHKKKSKFKSIEYNVEYNEDELKHKINELNKKGKLIELEDYDNLPKEATKIHTHNVFVSDKKLINEIYNPENTGLKESIKSNKSFDSESSCKSNYYYSFRF